MSIDYPQILITTLKSLGCLAKDDDFCRRFVRSLERPPRDDRELLAAITPVVVEQLICEPGDEEYEDTVVGFTLWVAVDYLLFLQQTGYALIGCLDDLYPKELLDLEDFPVVLYVKGDVSILTNPDRLAIVGTQEPSAYGKKVARRLGTRFAENGFTVVSDLAKGCDAEALWGCIEAGGKTIGVLAQGLEMVYPEDTELAEAIIASGGCLVSEYIPPDEPTKQSCIECRRIQAALGRSVIVVESEIDGGAMHTARYALELGRKLGCMGYLAGKVGTEGAKTAGVDSLVKSGKAVRLVEGKDLAEFTEVII